MAAVVDVERLDVTIVGSDECGSCRDGSVLTARRVVVVEAAGIVCELCGECGHARIRATCEGSI